MRVWETSLGLGKQAEELRVWAGGEASSLEVLGILRAESLSSGWAWPRLPCRLPLAPGLLITSLLRSCSPPVAWPCMRRLVRFGHL